MGSHQSRPSGDGQDAYVAVTRQIGKRSSMNILRKVDSGQSTLSRTGQHAFSPASRVTAASPVSTPSILRRYSPVKTLLSSRSPRPFFSSVRHTSANDSARPVSLPRDTTSSTLVPSKDARSSDGASSGLHCVVAAETSSPALAATASSLPVSQGRPLSARPCLPFANSDGVNDEVAHPAHRRSYTSGHEYAQVGTIGADCLISER